MAFAFEFGQVASSYHSDGRGGTTTGTHRGEREIRAVQKRRTGLRNNRKRRADLERHGMNRDGEYKSGGMGEKKGR